MGNVRHSANRANHPHGRGRLRALAASLLLGSALLPSHAVAEGIFQVGLNQPLREYNGNDNALTIDILAAGEVINISACGNDNTDLISFDLLDEAGNIVFQSGTPGNRDVANTVPCNDPMTAPLEGARAPAKYVTTAPGRYELRLSSLNGAYFDRFDVTVTPNDQIAPDPTGATGIVGRLASQRWIHNAGSFAATAATDADYYVLTPGGMPNTNYVWKLDLNNLAGFVYEIIANGIGVDSAPTFSVATAGNSVTPLYPLYLDVPAVAGPPPSSPPTISNFRFLDDADQDITFTPGTTLGVQDSGRFMFETNVAGATYAIAIDTGGPNGSGPDGIYGGEGDVFLNGYSVANATNEAVWDGTDVFGNRVPDGNYTAQLSVRLGEFHFVGRDIETSGGTLGAVQENGLTVWEMQRTTSGPVSYSQVPTYVYYDDESLLNGSQSTRGAPTPSINTPFGALSGTQAGYHTWGDYTGGSFGDQKFIDTFVYGRSSTASTVSVVASTDGPPAGTFNGFVSISAQGVGDDVSLLLSDDDLDGQPNASGLVTNVTTGDTIAVTLTPDPAQPGTFLYDLPTTSGPTTATELNVSAGDVLSLSYDDAANADGNPETFVAQDIVGGVDGVPSIVADVAGNPIFLSVRDADISGQGPITVTVLNTATGETEQVTLAEIGTTGEFVASLPSAANGAAGTNDDGTMNVESPDVLEIAYVDALRANGLTDQTVFDTDAVKSGTQAFVSIDAVRVSEPVTFTVTDGDRANRGTIRATITNVDTGESELITLTERFGSPGVFDGSVDTIYGTTPNGASNLFAADLNDVFRIEYEDNARPASAPAIVTATDDILAGTTGTASIAGDDVGTPLTLTVTDPDLAGDGTLPGVIVRNERTNGFETVTLVETGPGTGVFTYELPTQFGALSDGDDGNDSLNVAAGDTLTISYNDALTDDGSPQTIVSNDTMTGGTDGSVTITGGRVGIDALQLTATDPDLTGSSVSVTVRNTRTGETETVVLTGSAGSYSGSVGTVFGSAASTDLNDGVFNAVANDEFEISYTDAFSANGSTTATFTDQAPVTGGTTGVAEVIGTNVGAQVTVRYTDADLPQNAIVVTLRNGTRDTETVTLNPVGGGVFEAILDTTYGTGPDGSQANGSINAVAGDTLSISINDTFRDDGSSGPATASDTLNGGADGAPTIADTTVGEPILLTVRDPDLATGTATTVDVVVTNVDTGESETVTLTRNATDLELFEGSLDTRFGTNGGTVAGGTGDDVLDVDAGDTIRISYVDELALDGSTPTRSADAAITGGQLATVSIAPTTVGSDIALAVTDPDLATAGSLVATVTNLETLESEEITLLPDGNTPGRFVFDLPTVFGETGGTADDGTLVAQNGDRIEIAYTDPLVADGGTTVVSAENPIAGGVTGVATIATGLPGTPITLSVEDADLIALGSPDFDVRVANLATGEFEIVTLSEDPNAPGTFVGTLPTQFGTAAGTAGGANDDGTLNVEALENISLTYADDLRTNGSAGDVVVSDPVDGGADGEPTIAATTVGSELALEVRDPDLTNVTSVDVVVSNQNIAGESQPVTLVETAPGSGIFTATLPTAYGTAPDGSTTDNSINAAAGDILVIEYVDALRGTGEVDVTRTATAAINGGSTATINVATNLVGDDVTVTVTDRDRDGDGTIEVVLENVDTGESRTVTLAETTTGTFTASFPTEFVGGGTAAYDADANDEFRATYVDDLTANGAPATPSASDNIGGGVDATVGLVAGPVGTPLTLNVEDPDLPAGTTSIDVTVTNPATGEVEQVTLSGSNGVFNGSLDTAYGTGDGSSTNGSIDVVAGQPLTLAYTEPFSTTGGPATASASAAPSGGQNGTIQVTAGAVGDPVTVTLTDEDLTVASGLPAPTITLVNGTTNENETLQTVRVPGTNTFTVSVATSFGTVPDGNAGEFAAQTNDVFTATYTDDFRTDGGALDVTGVATIDSGETGVPTIAVGPVGTNATITISDGDLANGPAFTVTVVNDLTGEAETVTVTETVASSGIFEGTLPTQFGTANGTIPGADDDGTMNVEALETLTVTYADDLRANGSAGNETGTATVPASQTGTVAITTRDVGEAVTVSVTDGDLGNQMTLDVTLANLDTGETQTVTLNQVTPGTFEGSFPTVFGATADANTAAFEADAGDRFEAIYNDARDATGGPASPTADDTVAGGADASVALSVGLVGDPITITFTDTDLRSTNGTPATVPVQLANDDTGETRTVTLTETAAGSGVFTAQVATVFGTVADANTPAFEAAAGDTFTATGTDAFTAAGGTATPTASASIAGGNTATASIGVTNANGVATITVTDPDLATAAGDGTLSVEVTNLEPGRNETETVVLSETGPNSGIFTGTIATAFGTGANPAPGVMAANSGDTFQLAFTDAFGDAGSPVAITANDTVGGTATGTVTITPGKVGEPVQLSLTDADLANVASIDVMVENGNTGETETVTLFPVALGSDSFSGSLPTEYDANTGTFENGTLGVVANVNLIVSYDDQENDAGGFQNITDEAPIAGGVDGTLVLTAGLPGEDIVVTLTDADLAGTGPITVEVTNPQTNETEALDLIEGATGTFTAALPTTFGSDNDGVVGTMAVQAADRPEVEIVDDLRADGSSLLLQASAPVQGGTDGTLTVTVGTVGEPITVTLVDPDFAGLGSVDVNLSNLDTPDDETVTLFETSPGTFVGTMPTEYGTTPNTAVGIMAAVANDEFRANYTDPLSATGGPQPLVDTAAILGGTAGTITVTAGQVGEPLAIVVEDADLAGGADFTVTVQNPNTNETETVTVSETTPGRFEGVLPTTFGTEEDGANGSLPVAAGVVLTATYQDALLPDGSSGIATGTAAPSGGATATLTLTAGEPGDPIEIRLEDADLSGTGPIQLVVTNPTTSEPEPVSLVEGPAGTFTGTLPTVFGTDNDNNAGTMAVAAGDLPTVSYTDDLRADGSTGTIDAEDNVEGGTTATANLTVGAVGSDATLTVTDTDRAGDGFVQVTLTNPATGDSETLLLTEGPPGSGIFAGTVPTAFGGTGTPGDGALTGEATNVVTLAYTDPLNANGGTETITATGTLSGGTDGTIDILVGTPGAPATVSVTDADLSGGPDFTVTVQNATTLETETVTLSETGTPGTFVGSLPTTFGTANDGPNGSLPVAGGDELTATYADAFTATGGTASPTSTGTVGAGATGNVTIAASTPGNPATITLVDPDLIGQTGVTVTVVNGTSLESETVTLTETATAGTFTAALPTAFGSATDPSENDTGTMLASATDVLTATYADALTDTGATGTDSASTTIGGGNDATVTIAGTTVGSPLTLTLNDPDLVGAASVDVTVGNGRESETVTLTADPLGSGSFSGSIATAFGTTDPGPGTLGALTTDTFTIAYNDPIAANGGPLVAFDDTTLAGGVTATVSATDPAVGDPITITVVDPDRAGAGPLTVTVTHPTSGEVETVTLTETNGEFIGTLDTVFGDENDNVAGTIAVAGGVPLAVLYNDPLTEDGSSQPVVAVSEPTGGETGVPALGTATVGSPLAITVVDGDIAGTGTIVVTVTNAATGDTEQVTLTEDPANPGTFLGSVETAYGTGTGTPDGTLDVADGVQVIVSYDDGFRDDGSAGEETASVAVGGGNTGTVVATSAPIGAPQPIEVVDPDLAGTPSITVTVLNPESGGSQQVVLTASAPGSFTFIGALETVFGTVDDNDPTDATMPVAVGTTLSVVYEDGLTDDGSPLPILATLTPTGGTDAVVGLTPALPGGDVTITLLDPDLAGQPTVAVEVVNATTGETETILLAADPNDPTRFVGTVATEFGTDPGAPNDDALNVASGDLLTVNYVDPFGTTGGPVAATGDTTIGNGTTAVVSVTPGTVGTDFPITVTDPDLIGQGPLTVTVTTPSGDSETVTLVEDPNNPGTFLGSVPTAIVPPTGTVPGDGTISIEPGTSVTVTFTDPMDANGGPQTVAANQPVGNAPPAGTLDTASVAPGTSVVVPVLINDADPEGSALEIVALTQPATGGSVVVRPDGTLEVTADPGFLGTLDFTYTVSDPEGLTSVVQVSVTSDGQAPTAVADVLTIAEGQVGTIVVLDNDSDPSGTGLTITNVAVIGGGGTATINPDGTIEFVPDPGFTGSVQVLYEVTNGLGLSDTATVSIDVNPVPVFVAADTATVGAGGTVNVPVTANDPSWDPSVATITIPVLPAHGVATVLPDGSIDYVVSDPLFSGTDTFTYEMCIGSSCAQASVTITIDPPEALLTGTVFRDLDHDGVRDMGSEPGLGGWTVLTLDASGATVGTTTSAADGTYAMGPFPTGEDYTVRFLHPQTGELFDEVVVTLEATGSDVDLPLPIDPSGVVYDSVTREPIEGAIVTITSANGDGTPTTPLPGACLLGRDSATFTTGPDGYYEFFLVPGAAPQCPPGETSYALTVVGPEGQGLASGLPPVQDADGTPATLDPTGRGRTRADGVDIYAVSPSSTVPPVGQDAPRYFMAFALGTGDPQVVNNHLPLAVTPQGELLVTKYALSRTVSAGQLVPYRITVRNPSEVARIGVTVVDDLPAGFRYRDGSSAIDGTRVDARVRGRNVQYRGLAVPANAELTISLVAVAGSTIAEGTHTNLAYAVDADGRVVSNVARADVEFAPNPDFDCATVIGRVFDDANDNGRLDAGEEGIAGVRLATVEGVLVKTGAKGRYHLPCAMVPNAAIGSTHVMKLDERTLPFGYTLQTANPQMVRLTRGKATKVNFAVRRLAEARLDFSANAFHPGSVTLLPEYEAALNGLVDQLLVRRARLNLVYHASPGEIGGRERMRAVADRVERMWKGRGTPYELSIERTVERSLALGSPRLVTKG